MSSSRLPSLHKADAPRAKGGPSVEDAEPVCPVRILVLAVRQAVDVEDGARPLDHTGPFRRVVGRKDGLVVGADEEPALLWQGDEVRSVDVASLPLAAVAVKDGRIERVLDERPDARLGDLDLGESGRRDNGRRTPNVVVHEWRPGRRGKAAALDCADGVIAPDWGAVAEDERLGRLVEVADRTCCVRERP
jgi:hypothetical protein